MPPSPNANQSLPPQSGSRGIRHLQLERSAMQADEENRTVEVSFSSEEPVTRSWGTEILDHTPTSMDMGRLLNAAPVLLDHDRTQQIGVVEKAWIQDRRGRALLRFSRSPHATEIWTDILDGIRRNISVSYGINRIVRENEDPASPVYRVTNWTPDEISVVSVPADNTVGVGRSDASPCPQPTTPHQEPPQPSVMNRSQIIALLARAGVEFDPNAPDEQLRSLLESSLPARVPAAAAAPVEASVTTSHAVAAERNRVADIHNLYAEHNVREIDPDGSVLREYVGKDMPAERFQRWILENRYATKATATQPDSRLLPENQVREGQVMGKQAQAAGGLGDILVNSNAYRSLFNRSGQFTGNPRSLTIDVPMMVPSAGKRATLAATGLTNYERPPELILQEQQPLTIAALFSQGETTRDVIRIFRESAYAQAATSVAENGLKPEATFTLEEADFAVEKVAVLGRVTEEMFEDYTVTRDYVNSRLLYMVQSKEEDLLLNGNGTTPNIRGVLNTSGIQTVNSGASTSVADAVHRALTKVRAVGYFEPDFIVMNPFDWENIKLSRDDHGQYYGGGPLMGSYGVGPYTAAGMLWGKPVVSTTACTQGTALVGSFRMGAQLWRRMGVRLDTTNSDGDDFKYNRIAIRVESRLALAVYRPLAFCTVTGIPLVGQ